VLRTLGDFGGSFLALRHPPPALVVSVTSAFQIPFPFFLKSDNMEQNQASFCHQRFAVSSRITEPTLDASA
jgi:hypothetical protein